MNTIKRDVYVLKDVLKTNIEVSEGTNAVSIEFTVRDFDIPATAVAVVYCLGKYMDEPHKALADLDGNKITITPGESFFDPGTNVIQIRVVYGNTKLISFQETVNCKGKLRFADETEAQQQTLVEQLLAKMGKCTSDISNLDSGKATKVEVDVERKRIDNMAKLPSGSTTGDAELADIRVGADGTTYDTAGAAVREQVGSLKSAVNNIVTEKTFSEIDKSITVYYNGALPTNYITIRKNFVITGRGRVVLHSFNYANEADVNIKIILLSIDNGVYTVEGIQNATVTSRWSEFVTDFEINDDKEYTVTIVRAPYSNHDNMSSYRGYINLTFDDNENLKIGDKNTSKSEVFANATILFYASILSPKCYSTNWNNKTLNLIGDSITEQGIYASYLNSMYGIRINNYGVSGTTVCNKQPNYACQRVSAMNDDCDAVFTLYGTNDWGLGATLGTKYDEIETTFYGGLYKFYDALRNKYPDKPIFASTILQRDWQKDNTQASGIDKNQNGDTIEDFNDAIRYMARRYGIIVFDGYGESGICVNNIAMYTKDRLHLNNDGGKKYAMFIKDNIDKTTKYVC